MRAMLAASILLALAGCQQVGRVVDPDVAQLERYTAARAEGRLRDIAEEPVVSSCTPEKPACGRLNAIRGEACLALAMAERAPGAVCPAGSSAVRDDLACAAEGFAGAMASARSFPAADQQAHRQSRAQALYCRAELDTVARGVPFAREALELARPLPPPARDTIGGSAALFLARPGAGAYAARCAFVREAAARAREGLAAAPGPEDRALLTRLAADAEARRATIPGCGA